jgi:hypothetical protein
MVLSLSSLYFLSPPYIFSLSLPLSLSLSLSLSPPLWNEVVLSKRGTRFKGRRLIEWKKEFNEERNRKQQEAAKSVKSRRR